MNNTRHLLWMGTGFVVLLVLTKFVGNVAILLFPLLCLAMMFGMGHGNHNNDNKGQGGGHTH